MGCSPGEGGASLLISEEQICKKHNEGQQPNFFSNRLSVCILGGFEIITDAEAIAASHESPTELCTV